MGKIILINGSAHEHGNTYLALEEVRRQLETEGVETELLWLGTEPIQDCTGCMACEGRRQCSFSGDEVNSLLERIDEIDGIIAGSPVYYAGPSGRICSFLDRLFYASRGAFAGKIGASVVVCRRGGASAAFERLNNYFLMNRMIMPASQYWNMVYGRDPGEAKQDAEGMQTMRTLAKNIAWVLKSTEGRPVPEYEKKVSTNFIR